MDCDSLRMERRKDLNMHWRLKILLRVALFSSLFIVPVVLADAGPMVISLDGAGWLFATDAGNVGINQSWWTQAQAGAMPVNVPFETSYTGVFWYWRDFTPPYNPHAGGRYLLKFWSVQYKAQVWLNNVEVGTHENGDDPFVLDVTNAILPGQSNRLAVRVIKPGDTPIEGLVYDEIPSSTPSGGIWDSVELMEVPALFLDDPNKVFVRPNPATGIIKVRAWVRNSGATMVTGSLTITVNPGGFQAQFTNISFPSGLTAFDRQIQIPNPHLWDINDPYLYTLSTKVQQDGSTSYDEQVTRCGFRTFIFENGFFRLNGRQIYLHGAVAGNGNKVGSRAPYDPNLLRQDVINLKRMGFNAIRFTGGLMPRLELDACDELGILVYEETMAGWWYPLGVSPQMGARFDTGISGMIKRDRNSPSVVIWAFLNERPNNELFQYALTRVPFARSLDDHTRIILLNSGRFDNTNYGSIANPWSDTWETNTAYYPSDQHAYYVVPHTLSIINALRTMHGASGQGVLFSENGIGSALHLPHLMDIYTQLGASDLCYNSYGKTMRECFMPDWNRWNLANIFSSPSKYFDQCLTKVGRLRLTAVNAIRSNPNITGYYLTGNVDESGTGLGITNEFSEIKPGHEVIMLDLWSPLRFCNFVQPVNVYKGATINLEAVLVNENTIGAGTYPIYAKIVNDNNDVMWNTNTDLTISAGGAWVVPAFTQNVVTNWPEGKYRFVMTGDFGSKTATGGVTEFYILNSADESAITSTVTLWTADSVLSNWLTQNGIPYQSFDSGAPLGSQKIILTGMTPPPFYQSAFDDLMSRIAAGSVVIFLSPEIFASGSNTSYYVPLANRGSLNDLCGGSVFAKDDWAKNHPIFQNMPSGCVLDYTYYREIIPYTLWVNQDTPYEAVAGAINTAGSFPYQSGLSAAVYRRGAGAFILNTLFIRNNLGQVPAADRLLRNMIRYAGNIQGQANDCNDLWTYSQGFSQDLNHDCHIDTADFALFASEWLNDNHPMVSGSIIGNPSSSNGWSTTSAVSAKASQSLYGGNSLELINGYGLDAATGAMHSNYDGGPRMFWNSQWTGVGGGEVTERNEVNPTGSTTEPCWVMFTFNQPYALNTMHVWNLNLPGYLGGAIRNCTVKYSLNGTDWLYANAGDTYAGNPTTDPGHFEFPVGPGTNTYTGFDAVNFGGAIAKYVYLSVWPLTWTGSEWAPTCGAWAPTYGSVGLSEVRFSGSVAQVLPIGNPNAGNGWSTTSAVTVTASGQWPDNPLTPICAINGSGLDAATGTMHSNDIWNVFWDCPAQMGSTNPHPGTVACMNWIAFEFDKAYSLTTMHVWNYNYKSVYDCGAGPKDVTVQYSLTGGSNPTEWTTLGTFQVTKGTALNDFIGNDVCNFNGALAKYVCASIIDDWGSPYGDQGVAEVRFYGSAAHLPCGSQGFEYMPSDLDKNCVVNINDLAIFVSKWLACNDPLDVNCDTNW
jgi:hypothetical protein